MGEQKQRYRLTHPQQRIWYTEKLHPGTGMWNNAGTVKIKGKLDYTMLESAVNMFLSENESARLRIGIEDGAPYQYIAEYEPQNFDFIDFSDSGIKNLYEWDAIQTQTPMPLIDSSLYYFAMMKVSDNEGWLYVKFHHIISDGLSLVDFGNQLIDNYQNLLAGTQGQEKKLRSYIDFIRQEEEYLNSKRFIYDQQYWTDKFCELPEPTVIKQKKTNYFSTKASRKTYVIPARLSSQIRSFCRSAGISAFSLFFSALAAYINRITGKKDITIGTPVANRTSLHSKGAFGMYVSTVPIRIEIKDELTFTEFARVVSNKWFAALKHQKYPYDVLMQELRKRHKGLDSLYDVTLSYQIGKLKKDTEHFTYEGRWHFSGYQANSLSIHVNDREENGRFIVDYDHLTPFFSEKEIEYFHAHMTNILSDMIAHPDKQLYMLEVLSDEERERVISRFNKTDITFPQGETLADMWRSRVLKTDPDAVAVICGGQTMTYAELDERSSALALYLQEKGVGPESIVGLLTHRTMDYCVSVLAILKAGGAFLPLDAELPDERISYMLSDSGAEAVIVSAGLEHRCPGSGIIVINAGKQLPAPDEHPKAACGPHNLAYVIYTSGSTGRPKGVQIEHRSAVHFVYSLNRIWNFSPGARLLCAASISFDISVMELLLAFLNGSTLVLAQEHEVNIPKNMAKLICDSEVNMLVVTPGRMELLLSDKQGEACLKDFREIGMGGDVLSEKLLKKVQQATRARITNFYGPTEITVCATCIDVTNASVPSIGKPMPNVKVYILDEHKNPVPIGVPGELYIGGPGVSRGYLNRPELTSERFIDSPFIPGQKLYRTGDLTRWFALGEIEFLGRIDKQVKIRGYRVELGEIENRIMQIEGVTACAVADREDASGRKYLCAYLCGDPPGRSEIKAQLVRDLPSYMIPAYFVKVESLPFNASGKVDRSLLPDPEEAAEVREGFMPPETATEAILAEIWSGVLGAQQIGRYDSFFDIGGDSLSIVSVMTQVMQSFHVDISLEEVYRSPRLVDLAALIEKAEQTSYRPILKAPQMQDYPVSSAQQRMWVLMQGQPDSVAYNIPIAFEIKGKLDIPRLEKAFKALIKSHEALRTSFILRDSELRQKVYDRADFELIVTECEKAQLKSVLADLIKPFTLEKAPLMRAAVIKTGEDEHVLFIDMHHIISDKKTTELLLGELARAYAGGASARKRIEYKDYAVWQQEFMGSENISLQRDFWLAELSGELPLLNLHTDRQRSAVQRFEGARVKFDISGKTADKLRSFAAQRGATLFTAILAAYNILLSKYTGQEDIVVGAPVSGRSRAEIQNVAGVFLNTVPLRSYPRGELCFSEYFDELKKSAVAAFAHSDYPLERIVADLSLSRDLSRNPLFDTMLVHSGGTYRFELQGLECRHYPFDPRTAKLDITLEAYETDDGITCQFEYNTRLFKRSTIKRMSAHLTRLFDILPDEPDIRLRDVSVMTHDELRQVTRDFNQTDSPLDTNKTVQSIFEDIAAAEGEKIAVIANGKSISFSALNRRANQIAFWLREHGIGRNSIVAFCIHRSIDLSAALLGILKSGAAYLPIDPDYPADRISFMLKDSGARILLTDGEPVSFSGEAHCIQDIPVDLPDSNIEPVDKTEDAAYVIYTSGSTGVPKGVALPRRGLYNLYETVKSTVAYNKEHTCVSVTTVSFDIFIGDALLPLLFGCTVAICNEEELRQPHLLAALVESVDARFIQTTPTRMRIMMEDPSFKLAASRHIEKILLGGEMIPVSLLKLIKKYTKAKIINGYGPSEGTVYSSFKDLSNTSKVTIGRPVLNTRIYILDKYSRPAPVGVLGEAYISGAGVANGYINRDELTRSKFLPDPFWPGHIMYQTGDVCAYTDKGEIEMCGRVDHQVKIRGLRIELGEIEAAMRGIKGVEEAVVKDWGEGANKYLCAYYVACSGIDEEVLRGQLSKRLPAYMVPSYFVYMSEMPMTMSGKVDRKALAEPKRNKKAVNAGNAVMTDTERKMARVWSRILHVQNIAPDDSFFTLGGDSLGVIKVQAAVLQYGWTIRTKDFYECQTLRGVCARLNKEKTKPVQLMPEKKHIYIPNYPHLKPAKLSNILLTGATGYLGAHMLERLAAGGADIHCVVRGKDTKSCERYLREVLAFYFGMDACPGIMKRVSVIRGNITEPGFGIGVSYAERFAIDTVIHSAANTDHVGQPEAFYKANVLGTKHAIGVAKAAGAALLHVSTCSIAGTYYSGEDTRMELSENDLYIGQNYSENVYVKSKFQAEEAVVDVLRHGLNARIFRVGLLTGTTDGRFQINPEKNAFANRIRSLCQVRCVPIGMLGASVEMTPVDACADAVLKLAAADSAMPVYHVFNDNAMTLGDVVSLLEQNGYMMEIVSDKEFIQRMTILSRRGDLSHLTGLIEDLNMRKTDSVSVSAGATGELLCRLRFRWPKIDAEYMGRFVDSINRRQSREI